MAACGHREAPYGISNMKDRVTCQQCRRLFSPSTVEREVGWALALDHVEHALAGMSAAGHSQDYALALHDAAEAIRELPMPNDFMHESDGEPS